MKKSKQIQDGEMTVKFRNGTIIKFGNIKKKDKYRGCGTKFFEILNS